MKIAIILIFPNTMILFIILFLDCYPSERKSKFEFNLEAFKGKLNKKKSLEKN